MSAPFFLPLTIVYLPEISSFLSSARADSARHAANPATSANVFILSPRSRFTEPQWLGGEIVRAPGGRGQGTEDRGQGAEKAERSSSLLSVVCPLSSVLCPLASETRVASVALRR